VTPAALDISLLLAEDNEVTRLSLAYLLGRAGFAVEQACNGMEAVVLARTGRFRAILLDMHMPGMDGLRAAALIRRDPATRRTPIVMAATQASHETVCACVQAGASDFVVKQGLSAEVLIAKLRKVLATPGQKFQAHAGRPAEAGPASPEADGRDAALTLEAWREKAAVIGSVSAQESLAALEGLALPVLFPGLLNEVKYLNDGSRPAAARLVRLVEQDPGLTSRVLQAAAADPAAGGDVRGEVPAALDAVGGAGLARTLAGLTPAPWCAGEAAEARGWGDFWRHALAVSMVAGELAAGTKVSPALARAAGLLHEAGRWLMRAGTLGPKTAACYELAGRMPFPTAMAEQILLGVNYKQAGEAYCHRLRLGRLLAGACLWHDMDDAQLGHLTAPEAELGAIVGAADRIAGAAGFASLPNDELRPLPALVKQAAVDLAPRVVAALEEAQKTAVFRLGGAPHPGPDKQLLPGATVALLSPCAGALNPYQLALAGAGARVAAGRDPQAILGRGQPPDAVVLDCLAQPVTAILPALRRLGQAGDLGLVPKLVLARRSDEPEALAGRLGPDVSVLVTPIRCGTFLRTLRRLAER
jgi:CheY-like chemotaxis protein